MLLCSDQQQAHALGAVDDSFRTPHLDRLADRGTLFTGCHSTHPQCSPARSSLVTGLYPHQTGMYTLPDWDPGPLDPSLPSVARSFRDAGYETAYAGKWHLGGDPARFGWTTTMNAYPASDSPAETPAAEEMSAHEATMDVITHERAVEYLDAHGGEDPFFLTVSFSLPHPEFYEDPAFSNWYERDAVPLPESFDDDLADKPAFHRERALGSEGDLSEAEVRDIRYRYRTIVSRLDDHVGRVLDGLEANGLRDDTVVLFTSDHGDMQGAHRLNKKGVIAYDEILRVPLILDVPDRTSRRDRISDLCSWISIPSTLLDAAGLSMDAVGGESLLSAFDRTAPPSDEAVFFEHKYAYWGEHPYRGVRTCDWKYIEYLSDDTDELYQMGDDPHELDNLAGDPDYADVETELREKVRNWWDRTDGDEDAWTSPVER
jgi:choline-sulfatase